MNKDRNPAKERWGVYKTLIQGAEHFHIISVDVTTVDIREVGRPKPETAFRDVLKSGGIPPHEIDALVANAEWA